MPESLVSLSLMVVGSTIAASLLATMAAVALVRVLTGKVTGTPRVVVVRSARNRYPGTRS
jgi:hypothetical protein